MVWVTKQSDIHTKKLGRCIASMNTIKMIVIVIGVMIVIVLMTVIIMIKIKAIIIR